MVVYGSGNETRLQRFIQKSLSQQFHDNTEKNQYLTAFEFRFLYDIWGFLNVKHKEKISLALKTQN